MGDARREHALSFGPVAAAYAKGRPAYPSDAVAWALAGTAGDVLDLGAGTGLLAATVTAVLGAGRSGERSGGRAVVAVDPAPEMLAELSARLPDVRTAVGGAEAIPLPDASVGAVVAGQAAHWFDLDRAVPELVRVLAPGGVVAFLWNERDAADPFAAEVSRLLASPWPETVDPAFWRYAQDRAAGHFTPFEDAVFTGARQPLDRDGLVAMALSKSYVAVLPDAEREARLAAFRDLADRQPAAEMVLPHRTLAFRARLLPA